MDRADTEPYDGDAAFEDARELADAAEERRVRRRHEADVAVIPPAKAGPPARRLLKQLPLTRSSTCLSVTGFRLVDAVLELR